MKTCTIGLFSAATLILSSCAGTQRVAGPSTSGVETKISLAQSANTEAQSYTAKARTGAQRIEDKVIVIERAWDGAK